MKRFIVPLLLLFVLALAFPSLAQESEATEAPVQDGTVIETPAGDVVVTPDTERLNESFKIQVAAFVAVVITALWNLIYIPVAAPIVELLTAVTKRIPALKETSGSIISFTFTVIAWFAFVAMTQLGFGDRFDSVITGLTTIASAIFGVPLTQAAASGLHAYAAKNNVPILGHSRTPNARQAMTNLVEKAIAEALNKSSFALAGVSPTGEKVPLAESGERPRD